MRLGGGVGWGGRALPNEGVHADGGDAVQRLDSGLDLVLVSANVADEHERLRASERQDGVWRMVSRKKNGEITRC
jgi:hypothetical protein